MTLELQLRVKFLNEDESEPSEAACREQLESLVQTAVNRGLVTGESSLIVDDYRFQIERVIERASR